MADIRLSRLKGRPLFVQVRGRGNRNVRIQGCGYGAILFQTQGDSLFGLGLIDTGAMNQKFKPAVVTGGYGDRNFNDEWLWAASELFLTTKADSFYKVVDAHLKDNVNLPGWGSVGMMGYYSFLRFADKLPATYVIIIAKTDGGGSLGV